MNFSDLIKMTTAELQQEKDKILRKLCVLRMQQGMGESIKTHELKIGRRSVAQIETALNQKRINDDN